jgi:hypothetical protein
VNFLRSCFAVDREEVDYTPCEQSILLLALCAMPRHQRRSTRGTICARALASELADALRLIIIREAAYRARQRISRRALLGIQFQKKSAQRNRCADFFHFIF